MNNFKRFADGIQLAPILTADPADGKVGEQFYHAVKNVIRICVQELPSVIWEDLNIRAGTANDSTLRWNSVTGSWTENADIRTAAGTMYAPDAAAGNDLTMRSGAATAGNADGGDLTFQTGLGFGSGVRGQIIFDTQVARALGNTSLFTIRGSDNSVLNGNGYDIKIAGGLGNGLGVQGEAVLEGFRTRLNSDTAILTTGLPAAPAGIQIAEIYYDTLLKAFFFYNGTSWRSFGPVDGTVLDSTLRWDGSNWVENIHVQTNLNRIAGLDNTINDSSVVESLNVKAGSKTAGNADGGDLNLNGGDGFGTGSAGKVILTGRAVNLSTIQASDPSGSAKADIYFNSAEGRFKYYDGTQWRGFGGVGIATVAVIDTSNTTQPASNPATIDGHLIANGEMVLFVNLTNPLLNNRIYKAAISGGSITWTLQAMGQNPLGDPTDGDAVYAQYGTTNHDLLWFFSGIEWQIDQTGLVAQGRANKQFTGFKNRTESTLTSGGNLVTVTPVSGSFDVYHQGRKLTISGAQSATVGPTEGTWFVYFDSIGTLQASQVVWSLTSNDKIFVAIAQWDATSSTIISLLDERHEIALDSATHAYLHFTVNTRYESGLTSTFNLLPVLTAPSDDTASKIWLIGGAIWDEDLRHDILNGVTGAAPFTQTLGSDLTANPAYLPVYYLNALSELRVVPATAFPFAFGSVNGFPQYNPAGVGLSDPLTGDYVVYWLYATNNIAEPVISIPHPAKYVSLSDAQASSPSSINWGPMPFQELKLIYRLIYLCDSTYASATHRTKLSDVADYRVVSSASSAAFVATDHSSLSGLTAGDDHTQYALLAGRVAGQTLNGSSVASGLLTLSSTADVTKGKIVLGTASAYDENQDRLGVGTTTPTEKLDIGGNGKFNGKVYPATPASFDLGDATNTWQNVYLDRGAILAGTTLGGLFGPNQSLTTPAGISAGIALTAYNLSSIAAWTGNNSTNDANPTADVRLETGNKINGTGNSGAITLQTGTSFGGVRGKINLSAYLINLGATAAADPGTGATADIYYNTVEKKFKYYDGASWRGMGGGGGGATPVSYISTSATALPGTGAPYSPDGIAVVDGDMVLFTAFTVLTDRGIYTASVTAGNVTAWTRVLFGQNPNGQCTDGDMVYVRAGNSHYDEIWICTDTAAASWTILTGLGINSDLSFKNDGNRSISIQAAPAATAGRQLSVAAGAATGTDLAGGLMIISGGSSTGNGGSSVELRIAFKNQGTGTALRTPARVLWVDTPGLFNLADSGTGNNVFMGTNLTMSPVGGTYNTSFGQGNLLALTTGSNNVAVGNNSMTLLTTGARNTAVGSYAGRNVQGNDNIAIGYQSMLSSTSSANYNVAIGSNALAVSAANANTAIGHNVLAANTTGSSNTAVGYDALMTNIGGSNNSAFGNNALLLNQNGYSNVAVGVGALRSLVSNDDNVAVGASALYSNTSSRNTAVGSTALYANTSGSNNTAIGYQALTSNLTSSQCVAVGWNALRYSDGVNNVAVGAAALTKTVGGIQNVAIGTFALQDNVSGSGNVAVGETALLRNLTSNNTACGFESLYNTTSGGKNTAFGNQTLKQNILGTDNTMLGYRAGYAMPGGVYNVFIGSEAGDQISIASSQNVLIGAFAGRGVAGNAFANNNFIGYSAGRNVTTGSDNVAIGRDALLAIAGAGDNVAVGNYAGTQTTGNGNTFLGRSAGAALSTGTNNVFLGSYSDTTDGTVINSIGIGNGCRPNHDNVVVIGTNVVSLADYDFVLGGASHNLVVAGKLGSTNAIGVFLPTSAPVAGQVLIATSATQVQWGAAGGASGSFQVTAGENLTTLDSVYVSKGNAAGDTGRTAGQAYRLDPTNANRMNYCGFAKAGVLSGATVTIQQSGTLAGFSGLTEGEPVYGSVSTLGGYQITSPTTAGQWIVKLGTAKSATEIQVDGSGGLNAIYVGDDTEGTFGMANNQVAAANVTNLAFSGTIARGAVIHYTIYRYHTGPLAELVETGTIRIGFKTIAGTWNLNWNWDGDISGVSFSITNAGQIQYTSTNLAGTQQSFVMKWNYWTLPV